MYVMWICICILRYFFYFDIEYLKQLYYSFVIILLLYIVVIKGVGFFVEKKIRVKGEKKRKFFELDDFFLCVFNLKECKKDKRLKLRVLFEVFGNFKQTIINGDVSYFLFEFVNLFCILNGCN